MQIQFIAFTIISHMINCTLHFHKRLFDNRENELYINMYKCKYIYNKI